MTTTLLKDTALKWAVMDSNPIYFFSTIPANHSAGGKGGGRKVSQCVSIHFLGGTSAVALKGGGHLLGY